jgi:hypothetical protein
MATMKISNHITRPLTRKLIPILLVLIDRVQLLAWPHGDRLPEIPGFSVVRDTLVRQQTQVKTYRRVRTLRDQKGKTSIYIQYRSACPWLAPVKITVLTEARRGLSFSELENIAGAFKKIRLITVEVAFDFPLSSGVDRWFVLRRGTFGKSQFVSGRLFKDLRYGMRHSATMVRAYEKPEFGAYRVEIELHSAWLRKNGLQNPEDLSKLSSLLLPGRFQFVRVDWHSLSAHLSRKALPAEKIISRARRQARSLSRALEYLRVEVGLSNTHRFLRPLKINRSIQKQLQAWAYRWRTSLKSGAENA